MTTSHDHPEGDPLHHAAMIGKLLDDLVRQARDGIGKVRDPKAQALFETTAEVLLGLRKAYDDFAEKTEEAWR